MALLGLSLGFLLSAYTDLGFVASMVVSAVIVALVAGATQRRSFNR
jgi:uncharacterized membrane-anchored protein